MIVGRGPPQLDFPGLKLRQQQFQHGGRGVDDDLQPRLDIVAGGMQAVETIQRADGKPVFAVR